MKLRFTTFAALTALLATGCQTRQPSRDIVIRLTSAMPVSYSGVIRADGHEHAVSGITPATLTYQANRVDCQLGQGSENGMLTIEVKTLERPEHVEMVTASTGPNTAANGSVSIR